MPPTLKFEELRRKMRLIGEVVVEWEVLAICL